MQGFVSFAVFTPYAMPIYAYKCPACGHAQDVLQKMNDAAPQCAACQGASMDKQITAAGFQLKGSGWYADAYQSTAPAACPASGAESGACPACPAAAE
jgi:putative FmdB family regulatory protein